jgi:hypothetical protein
VTDYRQLTLRIPNEEYDRLKKLQKSRLVESLRGNDNDCFISLHSLLLEAVKKLEK